MKKSIVKVLCCIAMVSMVFAGGGSDKDSDSKNSVRLLTAVTGGKDADEMVMFEKELSEKTGFDVTLEKPPSDYNNVVVQKLQGGEVYDLIYLNADQYLALIEQGALMDITDKISNSSILSDTSIIPQSEWDDITIDGKIYAGFNKREIQRVVTLNSVLLKDAGIDYKSIEPTLDGYYDVLKALKENNNTEGFYPLNIVLSESYDLQPWFAAEGLKSGITIENGKRTVPLATDAAAPVWEWLTMLYSEGLIDPACAVDKTKDLRSKMGSGQTGVVVDWAAWVGLHNANAIAAGQTTEEYEAVSLPGIDGKNGYMLVKGGASLWAVPANAQNIDGAIAVLEFFATQEGGELLSLGIEGNDYTVNNGVYTLTEIGEKHGKDHGAPIPINSQFEYKTGLNPGVEEALSYLQYAGIEMIDAKHGDFKTIVGKWGVAIITGDVSVSEGLEDMRNELKAVGVID